MRYLKQYREPAVDIINEGFRPPSGSIADFCAIERQGRYHFFYIERRLKEGLPGFYGNECYIGHASTGNFMEWQIHSPEIWVQPGTWESLIVAAPNIIRYRDSYIMAYNGVSDCATQNIGLAFSDNPVDWRRWENNPLSPCTETEWAFWREDGPTSCRDAHLFEHQGRLWMAYTANTAEGASCIPLTSTNDLVNW